MDNLIIAILDNDIKYVEHFCDYMNSYKKEGYKFIGFTEESSLFDYSKQNNNILFVITESFNNRDYFKELKNVVILAEDKCVDSIDEIKAIYRYQASDILLSSILDFCVENIDIPINNSHVKKEIGKLICFYSPVKRCGKTDLAIKFAEHLKDKRVLLINLEEFSDFDERLGIESTYSIGDLIYFIISNNTNFEIKLDAAIKKHSNFDLIPSMKNIEDLYSLNYEYWNVLYKNIRELGRYDYIIVDLSFLSYEIVKIIQKSDKLVIPYLDNDISLRKLQKFNEYIEEKLDNDLERKYTICMNNYNEEELNKLIKWVSL